MCCCRACQADLGIRSLQVGIWLWETPHSKSAGSPNVRFLLPHAVPYKNHQTISVQHCISIRAASSAALTRYGTCIADWRIFAAHPRPDEFADDAMLKLYLLAPTCLNSSQ